MTLLLLLALCVPQDEPVRRARELVRQLDDESPQKRDEAERELRRLAPASDAVDGLVDEACRSGSPETRARALAIRKVRAAGRLVPDPEAFLERLQSPDDQVRSPALDRMLSLGAKAAPLAAELLPVRNSNLRGCCLHIIERAGERRYVDAVRQLLDDSDPDRQWSVLNCLSLLGDASIRPRLREMIASKPMPARTWPIPLLARLRHREDIPLVVGLLRFESPNLQRTVLDAISDWPEAKAAAADDLHRLAAEGLPEAMILATEFPRPEIQSILREALDGPGFGTAAFALAAMGDREAVPYLMHLASRGERSTDGIWGLGRLKAKEAVWLFRRLLRRDVDSFEAGLRRVLSAAEIKGTDVRSQYRIEFAQSPSPTPLPNAVAMAWALGEIGGEEAEALLLEMLDQAGEDARYEACVALGRLRARSALPKLALQLDDAVAFRRLAPPPEGARAYAVYRWTGCESWAQVREAAAAAMAAITDQSPPGTLDERARWWKEWWKAQRK